MKPRSLSDNFKEGDLLYGLKIERSIYKTNLLASVPALHESKLPFTVDELNNKTLTLAKPKGVWSPRNQDESSSYLRRRSLSGLDSAAATPYESHLELMGETKHEKLSLKRNDFPESPKRLSPTMRTRIRICKLVLLEYPRQKDTTIHFILDNIDLRHATDREYSIIQSKSISKREMPRDADVLHDAYTNAELRFIFKHYDEIVKNKRSVIFYHDHKEIALLDWVNQQPPAAKDALIRYAQAKKRTTLLTELGIPVLAQEAKPDTTQAEITPQIQTLQNQAGITPENKTPQNEPETAPQVHTPRNQAVTTSEKRSPNKPSPSRFFVTVEENPDASIPLPVPVFTEAESPSAATPADNAPSHQTQTDSSAAKSPRVSQRRSSK